jgi:hypothetical protein
MKINLAKELAFGGVCGALHKFRCLVVFVVTIARYAVSG